MCKLKSAKIFLCFAVLLFAAKPFLGFSLFSRMRPPAQENIFIKVFTKRKLEDPENGTYYTQAIQKKMADQAKQFILRFSFLLSILFPAFLFSGADITNLFLRRIKLSLCPRGHTYLLNGKLTI